MTSSTKECTCTPTTRCAEHLINDALDDTTMDQVIQTGLVVKPAISLADLYRKAKTKGVLTARTAYQ